MDWTIRTHNLEGTEKDMMSAQAADEWQIAYNSFVLEHTSRTYLCVDIGKPPVLPFFRGLIEFLEIDPFLAGFVEEGGDDCCDMLTPKYVILILCGRRRRVHTQLNGNQNGELAALESENKHILHVSRS